MRGAPSPVATTRAGASYLRRARVFAGVFIAATSHPPDPEARLLDRRVEGRRQCPRQHHPRLVRRDDAIVPEPRGRVVGIALVLVFLPDRRLEGRLLFRAPALALGDEIVAF